MASSLVYSSFSGSVGILNLNVVLPIPVILKIPLYALFSIFKLEKLTTSKSTTGFLLDLASIFKLTGVNL